MRVTNKTPDVRRLDVRLGVDSAAMHGDLSVPDGARALVIFAHGSGSSRKSPRNQRVAGDFHRAGAATLLLDLLTSEEEAVDQQTAEFRFDIPRLAARLVGAIDWASEHDETQGLPVSLFGASTGAAAALMAAAERPHTVRSVVSRGGRPDLAGEALTKVQAPTLLLVGGLDTVVIDLNRQAMRTMHCPVKLELVPGATHLFEEPGTLDQVAERAVQWVIRHLHPAGAPP